MCSIDLEDMRYWHKIARKTAFDFTKFDSIFFNLFFTIDKFSLNINEKEYLKNNDITQDKIKKVELKIV